MQLPMSRTLSRVGFRLWPEIKAIQYYFIPVKPRSCGSLDGLNSQNLGWLSLKHLVLHNLLKHRVVRAYARCRRAELSPLQLLRRQGCPVVCALRMMGALAQDALSGVVSVGSAFGFGRLGSGAGSSISPASTKSMNIDRVNSPFTPLSRK